MGHGAALYEKKNHIGYVTFNRPERGNAYDVNMVEDLKEIWAEIRRDEDVGGVVLTGAGDRFFSTGMDQRAMGEHFKTGGGVISTSPPNDLWKPVVNNGIGVMPGFTFNSDIGGFNWHTNSLVPLFAKGAGASLFNTYADEVDTVHGNYIDNTEYLKVEVAAFTDYDVTIDLNRNAWTVISTDQYLDADASSFDFNVSMVYKYTPEGFLTATFDDLSPVEALYVKTTGPGFAGLVYDANALPGVSTKDLVEGWNLISSGSAGDADDILSPLRYADIGGQQGIGLATLVSQGEMNLNTGNWYLDATNWANLDGATMSPFDGYWVYLNAAKSFGVLTGATSPK